MAALDSSITIRLDPESMAILERLALALEALVKQQGVATVEDGVFLNDEATVIRLHSKDQSEDS